MDAKQLSAEIKKARENSKKRKFSQSFDVIFSFKDLDLKKPSDQLDLFISLPFNRGKKVKVCALVGAELIANARESADFAVLQDDFAEYAKDKKKTKKLAEEYDFFIAQANIMSNVAQAFGRVLGPRNKMPNPKSGCVVPPKFNIKPLVEKLQNTVRVLVKTAPMSQIRIGNEDMSDEQVAENILTVYNAVIHALPNEKNNIRGIFIKTSMGKPVEVKP